MSSAEQRGKSQPNRQVPHLSVFFSLGFRPFFLGAGVFAVLAIGLWILALRSATLISPLYSMSAWHMHEMLFGYGPAVLTGFLLTAVPNWTGRKPLSGAGLGMLWLLWLAGRVAMMGVMPHMAAVVLDVAFLPVITVVMAREIIAGRNWRNLMVLGPIVLFGFANVLFHVEATRSGVSGYGVRLGLAALVFLVTLIGGRIVPAFTRNWLVKHGSDRRPVGFGRFDGIVLLSTLAALILWVVVPVAVVTAVALGVIAVLHGVRMARWAGLATRSDPLLFVLHAAYAMIPAGLALLAAGARTDGLSAQIAAMHLLGIGVVGGMTLSVMIRASLGHTGRALRADIWLGGALALIFASAGLRVLAEFIADRDIWIDLSAGFWMAGFGLFVLRIGPSLLTPRPRPGQA